MGNTASTNNTTEICQTEEAEFSFAPTNIIKFPVFINSPQSNDKYKRTFYVEAIYDENEKIINIIDTIKSQINEKYDPMKFKITWIYSDKSFINKSMSEESINPNDLIIHYDKKEVIKKGLSMDIEPLQFEHKVDSNDVTCKYMIDNKTNDPLKCPIYFKMKQEYEWNVNNYKHLGEYIHFKDEYGEIEECKFNDECKSFKRLESGGHQIDDLCHTKLYRHPPRGRTIQLQENINCLVINQKQQENYKVYEPTEIDRSIYEYNEKDGFLNALISEVILNKFKSDLFLDDQDEKLNCNEYTLLNIVDTKMESVRHKAMGSPLNRAQMLSLILYTGCDCNYDLCTSQRNGDYTTWKWFDYCLYHAISLLSANEIGSFPVFSGLNKVKLDKKSINGAYFVTYVSTSWKKDVAADFLDGDGMMMQFDASFKDHNRVQCCDVSWISKFPHECEILFARSTPDWTDKGFSCIVLDDYKGIQTISLSTANNEKDNKLSTEYWQTVSNTINLSTNKMTITKQTDNALWNNAYGKQLIVPFSKSTKWKIKINRIPSVETSVAIGIISNGNRTLDANKSLDYAWFNNGDLSEFNGQKKVGPEFKQNDIITLILDGNEGTLSYQIESFGNGNTKTGLLFEYITRSSEYSLAASLFVSNSSISLIE